MDDTFVWGFPGGPPGDAWEIFAEYWYPGESLLTSPANYTLDSKNGTIYLSAADALLPGDSLSGESWMVPSPTLSNNNLIPDSLTLWINGAEVDSADYSVNWDTGTVQ